MASSNLSMLVMEMIRSKRAERESQKDRAYDMWKLRETQEYNEKLTQDTREYQKEHEMFVISKDNEAKALTALEKVEDAAVQLGANLDTVSNLYQNDASINKLMDELVKPQVNEYADLATFYDDQSAIHAKKKDLLQDVIYNDLAKAQQIMVGGAGPTGGIDPDAWDVGDLSLDAYVDMYEQRPLGDVGEDIGLSFGKAIYGEGVTGQQITDVLSAYNIASDPSATYINAAGDEVTVGGQDVNNVLSQILDYDIPEDFNVEDLLSVIPTDDFDPETDVRDQLVSEFFDEKSGTIMTQLRKIQAEATTSEYQKASTDVKLLQAEKYELGIDMLLSDNARKKLHVFKEISMKNMNIADIYDNMFFLTPDGGINDLLEIEGGEAKAGEYRAAIEEDRMYLAMSFLKATDYDAFTKLNALPKGDARSVRISDIIEEYEHMIELSEGTSKVRQGEIMDPDYVEFYNSLTQAMDNYREADPSVKYDIMHSILEVFGAPKNIQGEDAMFDWYDNYVEIYSVVLGNSIEGATTSRTSLLLDDDDDLDDEKVDFSGYPGAIK